MTKRFYRMTAFVVTAACLLLGIARAEEADAFHGLWEADGVEVEIWSEADETRCRAVFTEADGTAAVWACDTCFLYEGVLLCPNVTRTRERYDFLWDSLEELDWSLNDMSDSSFAFSGEALVFSDEHLAAPITLTRLSLDEAVQRSSALALSGIWTSDSAELQVENHGVCYLLTVTVPVDDRTSHRWTYTCLYDSDARRMDSTGVSPLTVITYEEDSIFEVEEDRDEGSASFVLEDANRLVWTRDGVETAFVRAE